MWLNFKSEKGAMTICFIGFFSMILVITAFMIDRGNVMYYKHQLQMIADATSLAGASESYQWEDGTYYIEPQGAEIQAFHVLQANCFNVYNGRSNKKFVGWKGEVVNSGTDYYVKMSGTIDYFFPVIWGADKEEVTVESQSKVRTIPTS